MPKGQYARKQLVVDKERVHDAIVYLRHAQRNVNSRIRSGKLKDPDMAHALSLLALKTLEGEL